MKSYIVERVNKIKCIAKHMEINKHYPQYGFKLFIQYNSILCNMYLKNDHLNF